MSASGIAGRSPASGVAGAFALAAGLRTLSEAEFARFAELVYQDSGIRLGPGKQALLAARLAGRLRELALDSYGEYLRRVTAPEGAEERVRMVEAVCTHETHFFREPQHWEFLAERVFPRWRREADAGRRPRRVRAWSAACSTGEEPFSVAMALRDALPAAEGWSVEVLGSDISTRALETARAATWPISRAAGIPEPLLRRHMLRGERSREGQMRAAPELRGLVRFERINLHEPRYPVQGHFDLVFCRNVLIYFDAASRAGTVERLLRHLAPDGLLFLGHAESLIASGAPVRNVGPTVYAHTAEAR